MKFGYTFSKDTREVTGEQDTLRYSAFNLWLSSPASYRERYYKGKSLHTAETLFGSEVHKILESAEETAKHPTLKLVPRYDTSEYNIEAVLHGEVPIKIGGQIDSFQVSTLTFLDYKSSHVNRTGKAPWDKVKVARHRQLPFYSLLIELKHGKVDPKCQLVWLETAFKNAEQEFDGHTLSAQTRELELTGYFKVFDRRIAKWERDHMRGMIKKVAKEISEDFESYKRSLLNK